MERVLNDASIPSDSGIAIEYNVPYTSKRVDMIVSGYDENNMGTAIVIELKQWDMVEKVEGKDDVVMTFIGGRNSEHTHPSYQAWSYVQMISDFNETVQDESIRLHPCAFLHNYARHDPDPLFDKSFSECLAHSPSFVKNDIDTLRRFIAGFIRNGDDGDIIFKIDGGKLRPSKSLQDSLSSMLKGNEEFTLLDSQKVVYESIMKSVRGINAGRTRKHVVIIKGGPGTGKSVLAVNLLANITNMGLAAVYVTKNDAPRSVYSAKLKGTGKKKDIDFLFRGSGSFIGAGADILDVVLADEAHRLREKSGLFENLGENQIKEIINAAKLSVFFIDDDQTVTIKDIGSVAAIKDFAGAAGASVTEMELDSQFRCDGSDGYIAWLDDMLDIRHVDGLLLPDGLDYDIRVFDDPNEMGAEIVRRNEANNKSRLVAGYCWDWIKTGKNDTGAYDITIPAKNGPFEMSWNLGSTRTWAIDPESINEAGCIHTCQGLEFDYVGVIIGDDLRYENGRIVTDAKKRAKTDAALKGLRTRYKDPVDAEKMADKIIKDTYRVLMTRGMKGCFVYCTDRALSNYIKHRIKEHKFASIDSIDLK